MKAFLILRKPAVLFVLRFCSAGMLAGIFLFSRASAPAQSKPPDPAAEVLGTWEGESKCAIPDSPCHDEHVVYEIAAEKAAAAGLKLDAYKIVNGERQFMGTLRCEYNSARKNLSCTSRGKDFDDWQYSLSTGSLHGMLRINSGKTLYRAITVKKAALTSSFLLTRIHLR